MLLSPSPRLAGTPSQLEAHMDNFTYCVKNGKGRLRSVSNVRMEVWWIVGCGCENRVWFDVLQSGHITCMHAFWISFILTFVRLHLQNPTREYGAASCGDGDEGVGDVCSVHCARDSQGLPEKLFLVSFQPSFCSFPSYNWCCHSSERRVEERRRCSGTKKLSTQAFYPLHHTVKSSSFPLYEFLLLFIRPRFKIHIFGEICIYLDIFGFFYLCI